MPVKKRPHRSHCHKIDLSKPLWNWARAMTRDDAARLGGTLMVEVRDPVGEPHFHFLRVNGDNIPISMLRPEYIEPTRHKLTARERDAMLELFRREKTFFSLAWLWNNQNMDCPWVTKFLGTLDGKSSFIIPAEPAMPDYSLLEVENEGECKNGRTIPADIDSSSGGE